MHSVTNTKGIYLPILKWNGYRRSPHYYYETILNGKKKSEMFTTITRDMRSPKAEMLDMLGRLKGWVGWELMKRA